MPPRYLTSLNLRDFIQSAHEVPYQKIDSDLFPGIELWIRRDDLLDPLISGNKAYKLIYNLIEAREQGADTLITCGGAWSNHIYATAAAGARFGFKTQGIIHGERPPVLSATLRDAERFGMQLRFVTREQYRLRHCADFLERLEIDRSGATYIPEGGSNLAGARGVALLGKVIEAASPIDFDQVWLACGTGVTLAGLLSTAGRYCSVHGIEVLKAGDLIRRDTQHWLKAIQRPECPKASKPLPPGEGPGEGAQGAPEQFMHSNYHCGGYAKCPDYLRRFQRTFERQTGVPLDPVYTAKLLYGLQRAVDSGRIPPGSRVLALHSGGLQGGGRGYQQLKRSKIAILDSFLL
ncbi:1-aminocyclopropane-1-carboxylate deaminase/D-cysteine desulfhydrase [Microbulbifer halophilus]|uniref:1-aminocyclopropane-1-carboxylate deaminase/D-cysteine desulfhydrase n=1 Tax=Microbulbifer halophilus TaxID=453963 RepID=A0ABW5EER4_9GAMM|nr:pyridoxal-phosphate dependent enzyme [Microbulbifer halophilus]MCW8127958.1 pyridoxal-phosphate dependent enzyme [Microbulbifer halophilus]